jgi:hypothetical protein
MIVVVIIGILAVIAIPMFDRVKRSSENARFMNDLRTFKDALVQCVMQTGDMDQGSSSGTLASDFEEYVNASLWQEGPNIGGQWDVEYEKSGVTLGIGVHGPEISAERIEEIDASFDDGNVNTGKMRMIAGDRYYWVIEN